MRVMLPSSPAKGPEPTLLNLRKAAKILEGWMKVTTRSALLVDCSMPVRNIVKLTRILIPRTEQPRIRKTMRW